MVVRLSSAAIRMLVKSMPKHTVQWMGEILTPVWNTLTSSAELYVRSHINDQEMHNDPTDSDGKSPATHTASRRCTTTPQIQTVSPQPHNDQEMHNDPTDSDGTYYVPSQPP